MFLTYEAILEGNKLTWKGTIPQQASEARQIDVYVTLLDTTSSELTQDQARGNKMADALAALAALDNRSISDPITWQEEIRQDRSLPRE